MSWTLFAMMTNIVVIGPCFFQIFKEFLLDIIQKGLDECCRPGFGVTIPTALSNLADQRLECVDAFLYFVGYLLREVSSFLLELFEDFIGRVVDDLEEQKPCSWYEFRDGVSLNQ